jgi:hypothetical protein
MKGSLEIGDRIGVKANDILYPGDPAEENFIVAVELDPG